jgi:DNA-binding MarR family transcriptional regulator
MESSKSEPASSSPEPPSEAAASFYDGARYQPEESVGYLLKRAHASLVRSMDIRMQEYDLTALQWGPLLLIAKGRGDTVAACAREAGVDASAMTRMLDRLEAKGLIRRIRSAADRRVVNVELTDSGHAAAEKIPRELARVLNHHLRGFSTADFETLKNLLRRVERNGEAPA